MDPDMAQPETAGNPPQGRSDSCAVPAHRRCTLPRGGRHRPGRRRGDAGLAEFVVCLPVFFLLVIGGVQYALWSHASHLARAAAEQGSQVASGYGSTLSAGTEAAQSFIATTGPGTLTDPQVVTSTRSGDVAQVTVTGRAQALIPWLDLTVSATSNAPIQEYRN
jgi:Flp pilus assembly protein TadG